MKVDRHSKILNGTQFGKLTVLNFSHIDPKNKSFCYKVKCSCGNEKIYQASVLKNKKSCCVCDRSKNSPIIISAKDIWRKVYREINFNNFYTLSQLPCHYCNVKLTNSSNIFKKYKAASFHPEGAGIFNYNGLDRIDCNFDHNLDNVVPSCFTCNSAKIKLSYNKFLEWSQKVFLNIPNINVNNLKINNHYLKINNEELKTIKSLWREYKKPFDIKIFTNYIMSDCFYCNSPPFKIKNRDYIYKNNIKLINPLSYIKTNGLDRIDSNLDHSLNNVIPSCHICNWAKLKKPLDEFIRWINLLENNIQSKKLRSLPISHFIDNYKLICKTAPKITGDT